MPIPHRRIRGKLHYTSDKPGRKGVERGREYFTITVNGDGRRTLRAYTEIDDAPNVMRDVTLSLRPDWKPSDAFVRISVGDEFMGSSWFRFTEHEAQCEGYTVAEGRISQRYPTERHIDGFGTHPIQADAWMTAEALHVAGSVRTERIEHPPHVSAPCHGRRVEVVALAALVHHGERGARR